MSTRFNLVLVFLLLSLVSGCASHDQDLEVQLSGNRNMGVFLKKVSYEDGSPASAETSDYLKKLVADSIREIYSANLIELNLGDDGLLESADNLYLIGNNSIDDLFIVEIKLPDGFQPPPHRPTDEHLDQMNGAVPSILKAPIEFSLSILNGEKLRSVAELKYIVETNYKEDFEQSFKNTMKQKALENFKNPNIYPKSDPLHFATLLYNYSTKTESDQKIALNCGNAFSLLKHYAQARDLFVKSKDQVANSFAGQQERAQDLNAKIEDSNQKAEVLDLCEKDKTLQFSMSVDFGTINPENHENISKSFQRAQLDKLLQQYTDKPVKLKLSIDQSNELNLLVELRFDPIRYKKWTTGRIPDLMKGYHVVGLDPYYPLMQTLVLTRYLLPPESPKPLQISFQKMNISLVFKTLLNGSVHLGVDGRYIPNQKMVNLAYPKSLILSSPKFEKLTIDTRSEEIFQEKGWLTFGSCKTLDGASTEDGLVMKFFDLPCKI